jgi:Pentapeptide repeats (8 copies)
MADEKQVKLLRLSVSEWNMWRRGYPHIWPSLSNADLDNANLSGANLSNADLNDAHLVSANLRGANLSGAQVTDEQLKGAKSLYGATMPDGSKHP